MTYRIAYIVGSLSASSVNRILSQALISVAPDDLEFFEIGRPVCKEFAFVDLDRRTQ